MNRAKRDQPKMLCCCGASERLKAIREFTFRTFRHRGVLDWDSMRSFIHIDPISLTTTRCSRERTLTILIMLLRLPSVIWAFSHCWMLRTLTSIVPMRVSCFVLEEVSDLTNSLIFICREYPDLCCFVLSHICALEERAERRQAYRQHCQQNDGRRSQKGSV